MIVVYIKVYIMLDIGFVLKKLLEENFFFLIVKWQFAMLQTVKLDVYLSIIQTKIMSVFNLLLYLAKA